jgi:diguanylate cyclase (GGDEF)-like protein
MYSREPKIGKRTRSGLSLRQLVPYLMPLEPSQEFQKVAQQSSQNIDVALASQLSTRMPFVYAIAIVNVLLIANAFYGTVSDTHLVLATGPLLMVAVLRAIHWHPRMVARRLPAKISRDLNLLPFTGTAVAAGVMLFGLSFYPFGNTQQQSLIHYIATLTSFVGILGLQPSPKTALGMTFISVVPSITMFLYIGHENAWPISITMVSVSLLLLLIARTQHMGLIELIRSRTALQQREAEAARLNERLHRQAYIDDLTSIANRRSFFESFEAEVSQAGNDDLWLGLIDLDGFKTVNDLFGHRAGDAVLKAVAKRLSGFPATISCGRLGGDEFGFLMSGSLSKRDTIRLSEELARLIAKPVSFESHLLSVKSSIGLRKTDSMSANECIERADWALYKAKQDGGKVTIFSAGDEMLMQERARITQLFDDADLATQLDVVYQPIVDFDSGQTQSVEVLARWNAAGGAMVMPDVFIPMAESTHRTTELTKIIIAKSIRELPSAFSDISLHINLSVKDISSTQFVDWLLESDIFDTVTREQILLELTETAILSGGIRATRNLTRLRSRGFRIALDDFGVGQSSLSRIHKLPLDQIKIDKSFCHDGIANDHGWAIVATILALSRQIGLECVLEGVETEAQALQARSLGVRLMQGYYFSKPMSAAHFVGATVPLSNSNLIESDMIKAK